MSAINEHHDAAMDFAHFALLERARGNTEEAAALFEKALENELAAIQDMEARGSFSEPTYSVLHRSAGTLAMDCKQYRLAEQLAAKGLAHAEHPEIAQELRDLLDQVNFHRHLELRGVELSEAEVQLSLAGPEVGAGTAPTSDLTGRTNTIRNFIYRTIEWMMDRPFRKSGGPPNDIKDNYRTFVSVPRTGSFAVSLKLGSPTNKRTLDTSEIFSEFMDLMELANSSDTAEMEAKVPDPAYLRTFRGLAKKIAPDGERIRQVGFTAIRNGDARQVSITKPASAFPKPARRREEAAILHGWLKEVNWDRYRAQLHGNGGGYIQLQFDDALSQDMHRLATQYVEVRGNGAFNQDDKWTSVRVEHIAGTADWQNPSDIMALQEEPNPKVFQSSGIMRISDPFDVDEFIRNIRDGREDRWKIDRTS